MSGETGTVVKGVSRDLPSLDELVNNGRWTAKRMSVLLLCALALTLDGMDNQLLGLAVPTLAADWRLEPGDFALATALGYVGMAFGPPLGGHISDRYGRRLALVVGTLIFGLATGATALSSSLFEVSAWRFLGGLGLGAILPATTSLISEFTPTKSRALAIMVGLTCVPVGGMLGGLIASSVLVPYGWEALFILAGMITVVVSLILSIFLPESPYYLTARNRNSRGASLARAVMESDLPDHSSEEILGDADQKGGFSTLVSPEWRRNSIAIWAAFFCTLYPCYAMFAWTPTLLAEAGYSTRDASLALSVFNLGGMLFTIPAGLFIRKVGMRVAMTIIVGGAVSVAAALMLIGVDILTPPLAFGALFVFGIFLLNSQLVLYASATGMYPTNIRSLGVGMASGLGRVGAILGGYFGVVTIAYGSSTFFGAIFASMTLTFAATMILRLDRAEGRSTPAVN